jgi:uncharacterized protein YndB with AHSA1/START domain
MHDDNGVYPIDATLVTVVENEYLEGILTAETADGVIEQVVLRVQFHDHGELTRITLHQGPLAPDFRDQTRDGWEQSFEKLDGILAVSA